MRSLVFFCGITTVLITTAQAQEKAKNDPIAKQLKESKDKYAAARDKANEALIKVLDKQSEKVRKNKNLKLQDLNEQLKLLEEEKKGLKDRGMLPEGSSGMKSVEDGVKAYRRALGSARNQLLKDYRNAVSEYRRKDDLARATAVLKEGEAFLNDTAPIFAPPIKEVVLLRTAETDSPSPWLYITENPGDGWNSPDFDVSRWAKGWSAFGSAENPHGRVRTPWSTGSIWLRTSLFLPNLSQKHAMILRVCNDDDVDVFINGKLLHHRGSAQPYSDILLDGGQKSLFHQGENVLAVHCINTVPPHQIIDVGLRISRGE